LALLWVVYLGLSSVLLGLSVVRTNYRGYFLTKEGLVSGVLGY